MRREEHGGAELLLHLGGVTVRQETVRFGVARQSREVQALVDRPARPGGAAQGIDDHPVTLGEPLVKEGTQRQNAGRRVTARHRDQRRALEFVSVTFDEAVDRRGEELRRSMRRPVPPWVLARVLQAVVGPQVHHRDPARFTKDLKPAIDTAKTVEPVGDIFRGNLKLARNGNRRRCIEYVMPARHMEFKWPQRPFSGMHQELRKPSLRGDQKFKPIICLRRNTVSEDAAAGTGQDGGKLGVVDAGGDSAVERDSVNEVEIGLVDVGHVAVAVHVLAVEIGDDGEDGRELEEGSVALIGFGH